MHCPELFSVFVTSDWWYSDVIMQRLMVAHDSARLALHMFGSRDFIISSRSASCWIFLLELSKFDEIPYSWAMHDSVASSWVFVVQYWYECCLLNPNMSCVAISRLVEAIWNTSASEQLLNYEVFEGRHICRWYRHQIRNVPSRSHRDFCFHVIINAQIQLLLTYGSAIWMLHRMLVDIF